MNLMTKPTRPSPPKPMARKASPVNLEFEDRAKELLRSAITAKGMTVEQLTERLASIGVEMSKGGVANKISRGGFSAAFLLQCLDALELEPIPAPKRA